MDFTSLNVYVEETLANYLELFSGEEDRHLLLKKQLSAGEDIGSRKNFNGHMTASAYLLDGERCLMIHHVGLNKWLTPWGHWDLEDQELLNTAKRELMEETGVKNIKLHDWHIQNNYLPLDIDTHPIPYSEKKQEDAHFHHDFRFVFVLDKKQDIDLQLDEVSDYAWCDISELSKDTASLKLFEKMEKIVKGH